MLPQVVGGSLQPELGSYPGTDVGHLEGLADGVVRALFHGLQAVVLFVYTRHHDHREPLKSLVAPEPAEELEPVHDRDSDVQEDDVQGVLEKGQPFQAAFGFLYLEPFSPQNPPQRAAGRGLVIHDHGPGRPRLPEPLHSLEAAHLGGLP